MKTFFILLFLHYAICQDPFPVVTLPSGQVQGVRETSRLDSTVSYNTFKGIPYGEPPIGALRFQDPVPASPWTGVHNGTRPGNPCPQFLSTFYAGDENCLNLDVYTSELPTGGALKPVMFWIYGGAYTSGANVLYGGDVLMKHDVVLVVVNYRLGVFGFLSTGDSSAYGNQALKDQVLALQWVRDNIALFNGDPNRVTIFGESAGASSTHYLQISPLATGLFHQVLVHSGSAITPWAITKNPMPYIVNLANHFAVNTDTTANIIAGLQAIATRTLIEAATDPAVTGYVDPAQVPPFFPVIEVDHPGAFVSQASYQLILSGTYNHVPFFFGHTTSEGSFGFGYILGSVYTINDLDTRPEFIVSPSLNGPDDPHAVGQIIRDHYIGAGQNAADNVQGVINLFTNEFFTRSTRKTVDIQRMNEEGYFYRFSYEASAGIGYPGVDHAEDLQYYWYMPNVDYTTYTAADLLTLERVSKLFTNFAKFGNPTPVVDPLFNNLVWPKVTATDIGFVDIGTDLVPGSMPDEAEFQFWEGIFTTYGKPPYLTY